jgi:hypothetical protein
MRADTSEIGLARRTAEAVERLTVMQEETNRLLLAIVDQAHRSDRGVVPGPDFYQVGPTFTPAAYLARGKKG